MIALGACFLIVFGIATVIPVSVSHGEGVRYATPVDDHGRSVSELPPECRTLVRRLVSGENVSREFYEIRLGETTYALHSTNFSDRSVVSGRHTGGWRTVEGSSWHGRRVADWQLQEDYCAEPIYGEYRIDEDTYLIWGFGGESLRFSLQDAILPVLALGVFLIWAGQILRQRLTSR